MKPSDRVQECVDKDLIDVKLGSRLITIFDEYYDVDIDKENHTDRWEPFFKKTHNKLL